jgi:hypothetical protein
MKTFIVVGTPASNPFAGMAWMPMQIVRNNATRRVVKTRWGV